MAKDKAVDSAVLNAGLTSIADAIREKAGTTEALSFPAGMAAAIAGIETGGSIEVKTGEVTLTETKVSYTFLSDNPDIFILYKADNNGNTYSDARYVWAIIQYKNSKIQYTYGYNQGTSKYYVPLYKKTNAFVTGRFSNGVFNGMLGATTYKYIGIYGIDM